MTSKSDSPGTTREMLQNWRVASLAMERDGADSSIATEDQLLASRRQLIADDADCSDFWVFGYGSLIYNPIIDHKQHAITSIYGYHRRFCLWTKIGRGSPECPGLVLSLDRGGSCRGIAFQLNPQNAIAELDLLWRRAYAQRMPFETTVEVVARAAGFNGPCRDYLYDTVKGMQTCGIHDQQLEKLVTAVQQRLASD